MERAKNQPHQPPAIRLHSDEAELLMLDARWLPTMSLCQMRTDEGVFWAVYAGPTWSAKRLGGLHKSDVEAVKAALEETTPTTIGK